MDSEKEGIWRFKKKVIRRGFKEIEGKFNIADEIFSRRTTDRSEELRWIRKEKKVGKQGND